MINLHVVPNTGIQYIPLPDIDREKARVHQHQFMQGGAFHKVDEAAARRSGDEEDLDESLGEDGYRPASGSPRLILDVADDRDGLWIPLPVDRSGCWACVFLKPDGKGAYKAVLALDTTLVEQGNPQGVEQGADAVRRIAPCGRMFWSQPCVREYFVHLRRLLDRSIAERKLPSMSEGDLQRSVIGLAGYLDRFLQVAIRLEECPSTDPPGPVGVDVAIDIGNSRTCVLLKESLPDEDMRSRRLNLVYPSDPTQSHPCPFSTQSAFVEHEVLSAQIQARESFRFLSVLQLGEPAAARLRSAHSQFDPRPLGLSSPKRYLWDDSGKVDWEWSLADRQGREGRPEHLRGSVLARMDVERPLKDPVIPPAVPCHPRIACTVWTVIEILEQAFRQVNSIEWRRADTNAPHSSRRREILNVVVTFPAGMHSREVASYRKACERACRLWAEFRTNPHVFAEGSPVPKDTRHGIRAPAVHMVCDEGLSIQACWMYGMAVHTYGADVDAMLESLGRRRGPKAEHSLRVGSVDIGGGTIDVCIAEYTSDPDRAGHAALRCKRLFAFGVSRAGDEIVRALLQRHVFPPIVRDCLGGSPAAWDKVIAERHAADARYPIFRRQCVRNLWLPTAMHALAIMERGEPVKLALGEVPGIEVETLERLERELAVHGQLTGPLRSVVVSIDQQDMRRVVREAIGSTISQCADVIDQFGCDLLVVGGRPSSLRAVRDEIAGEMPVPPGQIFFLSEMLVEDWYPFVRTGGRISDAKTCSVFGGLVAFDALRGASTMSISPHDEPADTAKGPFIGIVRSTDLRGPLNIDAADEFDSAGTKDRAIGPLVGAVVAMRRIGHPKAEASPIYEYRLRRDVRERLNRSPSKVAPVQAQFSVNRLNPADERLRASRIEMECDPGGDIVEATASGAILDGQGGSVDAGEAMELVFKTMIESEGYWLDTGHFEMLAVEDL